MYTEVCAVSATQQAGDKITVLMDLSARHTTLSNKIPWPPSRPRLLGNEYVSISLACPIAECKG